MVLKNETRLVYEYYCKSTLHNGMCMCIYKPYSISAAASSALEGIKTQTRAGLEHIIGERMVRGLKLKGSKITNLDSGKGTL